MENNDSVSMPPVGGVAPDQPVEQPSAQPASTPLGVTSPVAPTLSKPLKTRAGGETSLLKTVIIILLALLLVGALGLAYYFFSEYRAARTNVDEQIDVAVLDAVKAREDELLAKFEEDYKYPYDSLTGPEDFGSLSLKYPRTWSAYTYKDGSSGEYLVFLHPDKIPQNPQNSTTVLALRVQIKSESFETATNRFAGFVKRGVLTSSIVQIDGHDATRYDGQFTSNFTGSVVLIKIRDKVAQIETDAEIHRDDFNKILETITFNE